VCSEWQLPTKRSTQPAAAASCCRQTPSECIALGDRTPRVERTHVVRQARFSPNQDELLTHLRRADAHGTTSARWSAAAVRKQASSSRQLARTAVSNARKLADSLASSPALPSRPAS
jgi:hypothetical protein